MRGTFSLKTENMYETAKTRSENVRDRKNSLIFCDFNYFSIEYGDDTDTFLFLRFPAETLYGWSQYLIPNRILVM